MKNVGQVVEQYLFETELKVFSPKDREVHSVPFASILEAITDPSFQPDINQLAALDRAVRLVKLRNSTLLAAQA